MDIDEKFMISMSRLMSGKELHEQNFDRWEKKIIGELYYIRIHQYPDGKYHTVHINDNEAKVLVKYFLDVDEITIEHDDPIRHGLDYANIILLCQKQIIRKGNRFNFDTPETENFSIANEYVRESIKKLCESGEIGRLARLKI